MASSHYLNKFDLSLVKSSDIHMRAISQEIPQPSTTKISLKTAYMKFNQTSQGPVDKDNDRHAVSDIQVCCDYVESINDDDTLHLR